MDIFGIPAYITYTQYSEFLINNFPFVSPETGTAFIGYLILIFIQLKFIIFVIDLGIKFITTLVNIVKKNRYRGW